MDNHPNTVYPDGTQVYDYSNNRPPMATQYSKREPPTQYSNQQAAMTSSSNDVPAAVTTRGGDDDVEKATFDDYIGNTTFHGCRFIFVSSRAKLRKIIWLLVVMSSIGLFTYQVTSRFVAYYEYQSNVNVEVVYEKDVTFPTVTVCNQNNYRMTAVVDGHLEAFMQSIFSSDNIVGNGDMSAAGNVSLDQFITSSAHQLEDIIRQCKWTGKSCNITERFRPQLTDFGQCYTFNLEASTIAKKGSAFGLSLVINIEQYEYSWGPHNEAGLKVLLHDPEETPSVDDLGFAVAPGTQTLVAVRREEIFSQPPPFGSCDPDAKSRSDCVLSCKTDETMERCGCVDAYMDATSNDTICDLERGFICLNSQTAGGDDVCECPTPCRRAIYTPELSYAYLSRSNAGAVLPPRGVEQERLQAKYIRARELSHHYIPMYIWQNERRFRSIAPKSNAYQEAVNTSVGVVDGTKHITNKTGLTDSLVTAVTKIAADIDALHDTYYRTESDLVGELYSVTNHPWSTVYQIARDFENYNFESQYYTLVACAELETNGIPSNQYPHSCSYFVVSAHELMGTDNDARYAYYHLTQLSNKYENLIDRVFYNTTEYTTVSNNSDHISCIEILRNISATWSAKVNTVRSAVSAWYMAVTYHEKLAVFETLYTFYNDTQGPDTLFNADLYKACAWYIRTDIHDANGVLTYAGDLSRKHTNTLLVVITNIGETGMELQKKLQASANGLYSIYDAYLDQLNETKVRLHEHVTSSGYRDPMEAVSSTHVLYEAGFSESLGIYRDLVQTLILTIDFLGNLSMPWKTTFVKNLEFVDTALTLLPNDPNVRHFSSLIEVDNAAALKGMAEEVYGRYGVLLEESFSRLTQSSRSLDDATDKAQEFLQEFVDSNELNDVFVLDNFLKLDIFYKEIGFTKVIQTPAFEFISLLSEVGGFGGLLLGASVLTLCELIDFLTLTSMRRCRKSGKVKPMR